MKDIYVNGKRVGTVTEDQYEEAGYQLGSALRGILRDMHSFSEVACWLTVFTFLITFTLPDSLNFSLNLPPNKSAIQMLPILISHLGWWGSGIWILFLSTWVYCTSTGNWMAHSVIIPIISMYTLRAIHCSSQWLWLVYLITWALIAVKADLIKEKEAAVIVRAKLREENKTAPMET